MGRSHLHSLANLAGGGLAAYGLLGVKDTNGASLFDQAVAGNWSSVGTYVQNTINPFSTDAGSQPMRSTFWTGAGILIGAAVARKFFPVLHKRMIGTKRFGIAAV